MTITTLTLSPAADIEYRCGEIRPGGLNRTRSHAVSAGGKGINVSRAILRETKIYGDPPPFTLRTVAPLGGPTGEMIRQILGDEGICVTAVPIRENTRVNVSLIPDSGPSLEINAPGTPVGEALREIEAAALDGLGPGDVLIIAGSCPSDVPKSYPSELIARAKERGAAAVLDCDGEALRIAVNASVKPDLIKPNDEELADLANLTGEERKDRKALIEAAESLGVDTVITTLGREGSLLTCREWGGKTVAFPTEARTVARLKGAGDTFLGAFVYAWYVRRDPPEWAMEAASDRAGRYVAGE